MNDHNFENIPKPKYVTEYRKFGDLFKGRRPGERSFLDKFILQTFVSLVIIALVLFINNIDTSFTKSLTSGIKTTISWNVDFSKAIDTFANIKNLIPNAKKTLAPKENTDSSTETTGETLDYTAQVNSNTLFIMPVDGPISSAYGERIHPVFKTKETHNGIDIGAEMGTPILSSTSGTVSKVGEDDINGKYVRVKTDDYEVIYDHCLKTLVAEGQKVKQGEKIAEVGDTGLASGPHLHFEVHQNGQPVNPMELLKIGESN